MKAISAHESCKRPDCPTVSDIAAEQEKHIYRFQKRPDSGEGAALEADVKLSQSLRVYARSM